jgi:hypothetical protein
MTMEKKAHDHRLCGYAWTTNGFTPGTNHGCCEPRGHAGAVHKCGTCEATQTVHAAKLSPEQLRDGIMQLCACVSEIKLGVDSLHERWWISATGTATALRELHVALAEITDHVAVLVGGV